MPTFHTKTISQILDPVAQQVSHLILLHEQAVDGLSMPDLLEPVLHVKRAVLNLVKVGHATIQYSNDHLLNRDMPVCLKKVEDAANALEEAAILLKHDSTSALAQQKLIEGSRGILNGTSQVLLILDQSEVRKIVKQCTNVLEFLAATELIHSMEGLAEFIRNLTPILSSMTGSVENRVKELTIQSHYEALKRCPEKLKSFIPLLVSALKVHVTIQQKEERHYLATYTDANRDYIVRQISFIVEQMIHILQLTHEETNGNGQLQFMEQASAPPPPARSSSSSSGGRPISSTSSAQLQDSSNKFKEIIRNVKLLQNEAKEWISSPEAPVGDSGEKCLQELIQIGVSVARQPLTVTQLGSSEAPILRENVVRQLESNIQSLCDYRDRQEGASPDAQTLADDCAVSLDIMTEQCISTLESLSLRTNEILAERDTRVLPTSQSTRAASQAPPLFQTATVHQLVDAAERWLSHPHNVTNHIAGRTACQQLIHLVANEAQNPTHSVMDGEKFILLADNSSRLLRDIEIALSTDNYPRGQLQQMCYGLLHNVRAMRNRLHIGLVNEISDRLNDVHAPLRAVMQASRPSEQLLTNSPPDHLMENLVQCELELQRETQGLCELGKKLAQRSGMSLEDENTRMKLEKASQELLPLTEQLCNAANVALHCRMIAGKQANGKGLEAAAHGSSIADEHFDKIRDHWTVMTDSLKFAIDEAMDKKAFMEAQNQGIALATDQAESFITGRDANGLAKCTTNIARRANRVAQVAYQERENSGDPVFVDQMTDAVTQLKAKITPMIISAKSMLDNMGDTTYVEQWRGNNKELCDAVGVVKHMIDEHHNNTENAGMASSVLDGPQSPLRPPPQLAPPFALEQQISKHNESNHHQTGGSPTTATVTALTQETSQPQVADVVNPSSSKSFDDSCDDDCTFPASAPREDEKIIAAAHALHQEAQQWSSHENELVAVAMRISVLMAKLGVIVERGGDSKRELIQVSMQIAEASREVTRMGLHHAQQCTDKRIQKNLEEFCSQVSTVGTQLKILSTVKASMLGNVEGAYASDGPLLAPILEERRVGANEDELVTDEDDKQNSEMLVLNAENLMSSVLAVVRAAEAASIKSRIDVDARHKLRWIRKQIPMWTQ